MAAQSKRDRAVRVVTPAPATPATPRHPTGAAAAQQQHPLPSDANALAGEVWGILPFLAKL